MQAGGKGADLAAATGRHGGPGRHAQRWVDAAGSWTGGEGTDLVPTSRRHRPPQRRVRRCGDAAAGRAGGRGDRICFTGQMSLPREDLEAIATAAGLRVTGSVSKKTTFLVCADVDS